MNVARVPCQRRRVAGDENETPPACSPGAPLDRRRYDSRVKNHPSRQVRRPNDIGATLMSGQATGWVLRHGPRDRALRLVLLAIADAANRDGECARPGMGAIIEGALYSEGHCRRAIAKLEAEGWLEETERPGPGKVAEFRLPGVTADNAAQTPRKRRANAAHPDARRSDSPTFLLETDNGLRTTRDLALPDPIAELCNYLADRIAHYREDPDARPAISSTWLRDMRLLVERGAGRRNKPTPIAPQVVRRCIDFVFGELAIPEGRGRFCWATNIRSPGALRDHWDQLADESRKRQRLALVDPLDEAVS